MGLLSAIFGKRQHPIDRWQRELGRRESLESLTERMLDPGRTASPRDIALREMIDYIMTDVSLSAIIEIHDLSRNDIEHLFSQLRRHGAGQWVGTVYVPVMALCWPGTLDFVIRKFSADDENDALAGASRLLDYFGRQEKGILRPDGSVTT